MVGREVQHPDAHETWVTVQQLQRGMCGDSRPHFFRGVATVSQLLVEGVLAWQAADLVHVRLCIDAQLMYAMAQQHVSCAGQRRCGPAALHRRRDACRDSRC